MQNQRGAIFIEHLMAIVLLGIVVAGVFNMLSVGQLSRMLARDMSVAANLAQRRVEEMRAADFAAIVSTPREPIDVAGFPGHSWEVEVSEQGGGLKQVTATVYWSSRGRERSVRLVTLVRSP